MYAAHLSVVAAQHVIMVDAAQMAVAVLAVSLGYFLRTVVPYVNARAKSPGLSFEALDKARKAAIPAAPQEG